uniref:LIN-24 Like family member n=2 Tax=Wuchereria bancrofti TaxID=6293 RepID=A0AAF5PJR3_WUCBA
MVSSHANIMAETQKSKDMVDLELIIRNWAKQIFEVTKTRDEAKINKKYLEFNINWSHLFNEYLEPRYTVSGIDTRFVHQSKSEQVLFKSTFTNSTERSQEYTFKTERCTRSTATISIEKGVCRGMEMELKLKTPCEIVEANAGFHNELSIVSIGENTVEEELRWGVDSTIKVPPLCETVAELVILEDNQTRNFAVDSRISGRVIVTVTNLKENNSLITIIEGKVADIIRGIANYSALGFTIKDDIVTYTTKGICKFKYGVEQIVKLKEHPLMLPSL